MKIKNKKRFNDEAKFQRSLKLVLGDFRIA